jgi:hypothetical protein
MIDYLLITLKTLPTWLAHTVDILIVAILFLTSITFITGMWCGLVIIGKRANSISEITFFPLKVSFTEKRVNKIKVNKGKHHG